ncbi:hypothetical protein L3X38_003882 [Prunus dulcis]|uniref:Uncharacterized protein n=1 Tax=Prunus dulcis TaxID=3755 RepID=A0AAD4ZMY9_PRUDU|nr:hypothetical protein L3X38_003882 [Prunus dulcis]
MGSQPMRTDIRISSFNIRQGRTQAKSIEYCQMSRKTMAYRMPYVDLTLSVDAQYERPCVFVLSSGIPFPRRHRLSFNNLMPALMTISNVIRMLA